MKLKVGEGGGSWCFGQLGRGEQGVEGMCQDPGRGPRAAAGEAAGADAPASGWEAPCQVPR